MASEDINIKLNVDDSGAIKNIGDLKQSIGDAGKEAHHTESVFKEMFSALVLEKAVEKGFEIIKDFFKESISEAQKAEKNITLFKNSLKQAGQEKAFGALTEEAEELSKKYGILNDDIIAGQRKLVQSGQFSTKQIAELGPTIANLARSAGISYEEASDKVVKATLGNKRALKGYQVEVDATKTSAENLAKVQEGLSKSISGAADAYSKTAAGQLESFNTQIEELKIKIGSEFLPILAELAKSFGPLLEQIAPVLQGIAKALGPVLQAFGSLASTILPPLISIVQKIGESFIKISPPILQFVKVVGDLVGKLLTELEPAITQIIDSLTPLIEEFLPPLVELFKEISPVIVDVAKQVADLVEIFLPLINTVLKPLITIQFKLFIGSVRLIVGYIKEWIKVVRAVTTEVKKLSNGVKEFFGIKPNDKVSKSLENQKKATDDLTKSTDELVDSESALNDEKLKGESEHDEEVKLNRAKKAVEASKKLKEEQKKAAEEELKDIKANQELAAASFKEGTEERLKITIDGLEKENKFISDNFKKLGLSESQRDKLILENRLKENKYEIDYYDQQTKLRNKNALDELKVRELQATSARDIADIKIKELQETAAQELQNTELTANQKLIIELKLAQDIKDIQDGLVKNELDAQIKVLDAKTKSAEQELEIAKKSKDSTLAEIQDLEDKVLQAKINELELKRQAEVAAAEQAGLDTQAIDEKYHQEEIDATKKTEEAKSEERKKAVEQDIQTAQSYVSAIGDLTDLITTISSAGAEKDVKKQNEIKKRQFNANKALGIVNAGIHTAEGITKTIGELGFPAAIPGVIAAGIAGAAQIAAIAAKKFNPEGGSSGGASSAPTTGGGPLPTIPSTSQFQPQKFFDLGNSSLLSGNQAPPAQKVYVTETDITKTQNKVSLIEARAKIG